MPKTSNGAAGNPRATGAIAGLVCEDAQGIPRGSVGF
jgi:hypothetical protein